MTLQTASTHLSKLDEGGLLRPRKQGRHKYFSLANDDVARVLEGLMGLAAGSGHLRSRTGPRDPALRKARVCYNHLAGDLGIRLFDSLVSRDFLQTRRGALHLSKAGHVFANDFGIDVGSLLSRKVPLCRECLDWSARRSHLAGSLGAHSSAVLREGLGKARTRNKGRALRHWARKRSAGRFRLIVGSALALFLAFTQIVIGRA